jgi:predicted house-cleaning noncanonical NTP pyrophosphatase (MazG superfamily)
VRLRVCGVECGTASRRDTGYWRCVHFLPRRATRERGKVSRTIHEKLVRDRIPEIYEAEGKHSEVRTLDEAEFIAALKSKLCDEAEELKGAWSQDAVLQELAEVVETVQALALASGLSMTEVERMRQHRLWKRGGFENRVHLIAVTEDE